MANHKWAHLYNCKAWYRLRASQLRREPMCGYCSALGLVVLATICDHRRPHRGDPALFFDPANLQSLCKHCHDSHKQRLEKSGGVLPGCNAAGVPLDPLHHWNK